MDEEEKKERIRELFRELYGDELLEYEDRKLGTVDQVRTSIFKELLESIVDMDEEYSNYYIEEFKDLINELRNKDDYDIVEIIENDMSAYYTLISDDNLLEELNEAYNLEKKYEEKDEREEI